MSCLNHLPKSVLETPFNKLTKSCLLSGKKLQGLINNGFMETNLSFLISNHLDILNSKIEKKKFRHSD